MSVDTNSTINVELILQHSAVEFSSTLVSKSHRSTAVLRKYGVFLNSSFKCLVRKVPLNNVASTRLDACRRACVPSPKALLPRTVPAWVRGNLPPKGRDEIAGQIGLRTHSVPGTGQ